MKLPIEGACQCGKVTYTLHQKPKMVFACHCTECQKLATGPFSVTAVVDADAIEFHGEMGEWSRIADSGNTNIARFCKSCGNRIYHFNPDDDATVKLKLKPVDLDDDTIFEPQAHIWVSEKLRWFQIPEDIKTFAQQP